MLELDGLSHRYGDELAVDDVSFGVDAGELVGVLGPSGCGKTTIVQAIAGHVQPTAGRVLLRDTDVTDTPPEARHVGVVFQRSTLFPHMTARENVAYGLGPLDIDPARRDDLVAEYLDLVGLEANRHAVPTELSGGQRRRVELARALAPQPDVLVLDEPLSALDRALRSQLRDEIARIQDETGVTTLVVTHDQTEAMALADRLVVMETGRVASVGTPRSLYESPPNPFVASFLGRSNTLSATVVERDPLTIAVGNREIALPDADARSDDAAVDSCAGASVTCHVRPDALSLQTAGADETAVGLAGEVVRVADLGRRYDVTVRIEPSETIVVEQSTTPPAVGESVTVSVPPRQLTLFESTTRSDQIA